MANKRLPDNVHKMKGTLQPCRHGKAEDKPNIVIKPPSAPSMLSTGAKREWTRVCKVLAKANVLAETDRVTLAQYCELYAEFAEDPREFTAAKHTQLRLLNVELGFTPSARAKLKPIETGDKPKDPWDDL